MISSLFTTLQSSECPDDPLLSRSRKEDSMYFYDTTSHAALQSFKKKKKGLSSPGNCCVFRDTFWPTVGIQGTYICRIQGSVHLRILKIWLRAQPYLKDWCSRQWGETKGRWWGWGWLLHRLPLLPPSHLQLQRETRLCRAPLSSCWNGLPSAPGFGKFQPKSHLPHLCSPLPTRPVPGDLPALIVRPAHRPMHMPKTIPPPAPGCAGIWKWGLGEVIRAWGCSLRERDEHPYKRDPGAPSPLLPREAREKSAVSGRWALARRQHINLGLLSLQNPEREISTVQKPPSLRYSIIAAQVDDTLFSAASMAYGSSCTRDRTQAAAVTSATAGALWDPSPTLLAWGSNQCCHRDNAISLTHCATVGTPGWHTFIL